MVQIPSSDSGLAAYTKVTYIPTMSTMIKEPKAHRFAARLTGADKQLLQKAAMIEGRSMATFVIVHAREVAKQIIQNESSIRLNAEQSVRFVEALLAPPRPPTRAMQESIRAYRKMVKSDLD